MQRRGRKKKDIEEIDSDDRTITFSLLDYDIQIMIAAFPAPVMEGIRKDRQLSAK